MSAGGKGAGMGAVLAAHRFVKALGQCTCGWQHEPQGHREEQHRAHLVAALEAAGYGDLAQARAEALNEAADALDDHTNCQCDPEDGAHLRHLAGSEWLRARAEQQAHSGGTP